MLGRVLFLSGLLQVVVSLKCHSCSGADAVPTIAKGAITKLNLTQDVPLRGNCSATSGENVCMNGLFCIKKSVIYQVGVDKINVKWNTYTMGCASTRADNNGIPSNTCYDIATKDEKGYKVITKHCYCSTDFCNGSTIKQIFIAIAASFMLSLIQKLV
ncbi:hypothetical protein WR25_03784 [Diploscapter pachys]|uniref:Protein sleepless n=1 Tax=Diploscapter pachys TaxID=2018661 RepID=A0A2A2LNK9_9BILA|nr:hypothetical protein WR25_03784 [Diploscapter pachys]